MQARSNTFNIALFNYYITTFIFFKKLFFSLLAKIIILLLNVWNDILQTVMNPKLYMKKEEYD